jgi:magnesium chelatase family protein
MLAAAVNYPDKTDRRQAQLFKEKLSAPLMDRIDLKVSTGVFHGKDLFYGIKLEPSKEIRKRIKAAIAIQGERFRELTGSNQIDFNGQMRNDHVSKYCKLDEDTKQLMKLALEKSNLSVRGYYKTLKVSRTIADLEGARKIHIRHLQEALQYTLIIRSDPLGNLEIKN